MNMSTPSPQPAKQPIKVLAVKRSTPPKKRPDSALRQREILRSEKPSREQCERAYRNMTMEGLLDLTDPKDVEVGRMIFSGLLD